MHNRAKTEGLRLGKTKRSYSTHESADGIQWVKVGEWIRTLGFPVGEDFDPNDFLMARYLKLKRLLVTWAHKIIKQLTIYGRAMIVNSLCYSRFRFYAGAMALSQELMNAITEDAQAIIWNKDLEFEADELGSDLDRRPLIKEGVLYRPRSELGLGLLHWPSHVKGLQIKLLVSYNDASTGEWKRMLDCWLARTREGRGALFANYRIKDLIQSNSGRATHLPRVFIAALHAIRELTLIPMNPAEVTCREEAWAEPFWASWRIDMKGFQHVDFWQRKIDVNRVGDAMDFSQHKIVTGEECVDGWIDHLSENPFVKVSPIKYVKKEYFRKQWDRMMTRLPSHITRAAISLDSYVIGQGISMIAYNIMKKMGWTGGPLQGGQLAPPPTPTGNKGTESLDLKNLRRKRNVSWWLTLQAKAKWSMAWIRMALLRGGSWTL